LRTEIERSLETLTPREADVVRLYFGLGDQHPMTLEIGETLTQLVSVYVKSKKSNP
jgi:RNA polymerase primary sigma factor